MKGMKMKPDQRSATCAKGAWEVEFLLSISFIKGLHRVFLSFFCYHVGREDIGNMCGRKRT